MADKEIGITIKVKDAASAALGKFQSASQGVDKGVAGMAKSITSSFSLAGKSFIALNQGLELFGKVNSFFQKTIGGTITKALEYRMANDSAKQSITSLEKNLGTLQARMGDAFMPLLQALAQTFNPIIDRVLKWLSANEKLIQGKVIEWAASLARILSTAVFGSVQKVIEVWKGWEMIIGVVQDLANNAFASILEGVDSLVGGMEKVARWAGKEELADSIAEVRRGIQDFAKDARASGEAGQKAAIDASRELTEYTRVIGQTKAAVDSAINQASVQAFKNVDGVARRATENAEAYRERLAKLGEEAKKISDQMDEAMKRLAANDEKLFQEHLKRLETDRAELFKTHDAKLASEEENLARRAEISNKFYELQKENEDRYREHIQSVVNEIMSWTQATLGALADSFADVGKLHNETVTEIVQSENGMLIEQTRVIEQHVKTVGDAVGGFLLRMTQSVLEYISQTLIAKGTAAAVDEAFTVQKVTGNAVEAGSEVAKQYTETVPLVGWAIGLGIAAAVIAGIIGLLSMRKAGGFIEGGTPGLDSVLFRGTSGEYVVSNPEMRDWRDNGRMPARMGPPGSRGASTSSDDARVPLIGTLVLPSLERPDQLKYERVMNEDLIPVFQRALNSGRLRIPRGALA